MLDELDDDGQLDGLEDGAGAKPENVGVSQKPEGLYRTTPQFPSDNSSYRPTSREREVYHQQQQQAKVRAKKSEVN